MRPIKSPGRETATAKSNIPVTQNPSTVQPAPGTPTAAPGSPISIGGGNQQNPAGPPWPPVTEARAQVSMVIPEALVPFGSGLSSILFRNILQPVTKYSMYFQPGGEWTQSPANGQVKRTEPFSLQDVLKASWTMHIVESNPELMSVLGGRFPSVKAQ